VASHKEDAHVPDEDFSFGVPIEAQAQGDFQVLQNRQRRISRIDLGVGVEEGVHRIQRAVAEMGHQRI